MLLSGSLESMDGAEAFAVFEILQKTQYHHADGYQNENIGMRKIGQGANQRNDHAGSRKDGEAERIDPAALNERSELFAVEYLSHGDGSLLKLRKIDR